MTYPNAEQLPMIIKLQPLFKKMMGEWQFGDTGYDSIGQGVCFCTFELPLEFSFPTGRVHDISKIIRIPAPLDLTCSPRCLWGMIGINFISFNCNYSSKGGVFHISEWVLVIEIEIDGELKTFKADNPVTAMLMALVEQNNL
jgi:hypothetical protein